MPCRIEYISRMKKSADIKRILKDLEAGKVDIIIGTHRLTSNDIKFKDLGLLVIDEEQKFGVAVKERLKRFEIECGYHYHGGDTDPADAAIFVDGGEGICRLSVRPRLIVTRL